MMKYINDQISKRLNQIRQAFIGTVTLGGASVQVQGLNDELLNDVEVIQHVGFTSRLPKGCRVVVLPMMGKTKRAVVIASDKATISVVVEEGETAVHDQFGHKILLKEDGIHYYGKSFFHDDVHVTGNVTASEEVTDSKSSMDDMRETFNTHAGHYSPLNKVPDTPMG